MNKKILIICALIIGAVGFTLYCYHSVDKSFLKGRTLNPLWSISELDPTLETGDFTDASTTVIAVLNPTSATATIDLFIYDNDTAATSSHTLTCGTSTNAFTAPVGDLMVNTLIATSVTKYLIGGGSQSGSVIDKVKILPDEYFVCSVSATYDAGGFTDAGNSYDGSYALRFLELINN